MIGTPLSEREDVKPGPPMDAIALLLPCRRRAPSANPPRTLKIMGASFTRMTSGKGRASSPHSSSCFRGRPRKVSTHSPSPLPSLNSSVFPNAILSSAVSFACSMPAM